MKKAKPRNPRVVSSSISAATTSSSSSGTACLTNSEPLTKAIEKMMMMVTKAKPHRALMVISSISFSLTPSPSPPFPCPSFPCPSPSPSFFSPSALCSSPAAQRQSAPTASSQRALLCSVSVTHASHPRSGTPVKLQQHAACGTQGAAPHPRCAVRSPRTHVHTTVMRRAAWSASTGPASSPRAPYSPWASMVVCPMPAKVALLSTPAAPARD